ncbi:hypothetical protein [Vibrio harveyi]|uniref:hypothetical protein n=1 Tax=Vibrio harveyi TaxID=669 RepID=UPI003CEB0C48
MKLFKNQKIYLSGILIKHLTLKSMTSIELSEKMQLSNYQINELLEFVMKTGRVEIDNTAFIGNSSNKSISRLYQLKEQKDKW